MAAATEKQLNYIIKLVEDAQNFVLNQDEQQQSWFHKKYAHYVYFYKLVSPEIIQSSGMSVKDASEIISIMKGQMENTIPGLGISGLIRFFGESAVKFIEFVRNLPANSELTGAEIVEAYTSQSRGQILNDDIFAYPFSVEELQVKIEALEQLKAKYAGDYLEREISRTLTSAQSALKIAKALGVYHYKKDMFDVNETTYYAS